MVQGASEVPGTPVSGGHQEDRDWTERAREDHEGLESIEDDEGLESLEDHHQFRWAGYSAISPHSPPADVDETTPEVGFVEPNDVYEPEAIVDERFHNGPREVRVRWVSYGPEEDTWEPLKHLLVGGQQLLRNWRKSRRL